MKDQEDKIDSELYYTIHSAMDDFYKAVKLIARITMSRLGLARVSCAPESWLAVYQDKIMLTHDLSRHDCISRKEAKIAALKEAAQWLENYGGSPQRKKRGLEMIEQRIKQWKGEIE